MGGRTVVGDWITDEYASELEEFATERGLSHSRVKRTFRDHCEMFQEEVMDDTAPEIVRRLAYDKLKWHSPANSQTDGTEAE